MISVMEVGSREVAMPEVADGLAKCPECGGEIQATAKLYLSLEAAGWSFMEIGETEPHLYCENDHDLAGLVDGDRYIALEGSAVSALAGSFADQPLLDQIRDLLDGTEWNVDTVGEIARIVRGTGREVRDLA
jgi:hypothetical protein